MLKGAILFYSLCFKTETENNEELLYEQYLSIDTKILTVYSNLVSDRIINDYQLSIHGDGGPRSTHPHAAGPGHSASHC